MKASYLSEKFDSALKYEDYVKTGTDEQQRRWKQVYDAAALTDVQKRLVFGFTREMKLLIVSGIWCGDCVQQCPLLARIQEANLDTIQLRLLDRDQHRDLTEQCRINAGDRVPVVLFLAEDFEFCAAYGERTINRYRALVRRYLDPACDTGIVSPDASEMAATLADWLVEVERIQLLLRFSPRLRQRHGD
jgi:thiol-disulfide isomerase/thioredoxin